MASANVMTSKTGGFMTTEALTINFLFWSSMCCRVKKRRTSTT